MNQTPTLLEIKKILKENNIDFFINDKQYPLVKIRVYVSDEKQKDSIPN